MLYKLFEIKSDKNIPLETTLVFGVAQVCREIDLAGEIARIVGVDPRQKVTLRRGCFCHGPERPRIC